MEMTLEQARDYAKMRLEELEPRARILIMKKENAYIVTTDYRTYKDLGYELYESYYNY